MLNADIQERIQRGINYLNQEAPGWENRIYFNTLQLSNCTNCVLGQLFGGYFSYLEKNFPSCITVFNGPADEWACEHAFQLTLEEQRSVVEDDYAELTNLWKQAILDLRQRKKELSCAVTATPVLPATPSTNLPIPNPSNTLAVMPV